MAAGSSFREHRARPGLDRHVAACGRGARITVLVFPTGGGRSSREGNTDAQPRHRLAEHLD
jgi:hypothetical protein